MQVIDKLLKAVLVAVMLGIAIIVGSNVFCRFVLNFSLSWADETAQILLVWLTFLGAALCIKGKSHYVLHFLSTRLEGKARLTVAAVARIFGLVAITALLYYSAIVTWEIRPWVMPATEISRAWVYSACPVGCLLMLVYEVEDIILLLKSKTPST